MSFPAYPEYKDSGVAWLGEVPSHWRFRPLLALVEECNFSNLGMIESNLLSLSYGRIIEKDISSNDGLLPESFETYQIVDHGDIILRLTDLQNDQRSLRSGLVKRKGIITSAYTAIRPHGIHSKYLAHLMRAYDLQKVFYSMGGGLRQTMKYADLRHLPVLEPSLVEQASIAAFLDHETAKIDALIAEQEKLIELLKEKRLAVISHAVTKGLDPNAPMKDSGVEWLGQVPEHWDVAQIKQLIRLATSGPRGWADLIADEGALFFQSQNIGYVMDVVIENSQSIIPPQNSEAMRARLLADDVVMCITGGRTGAVAHLAQDIGEAYINQHVCLLRPNSSVCGRYLAYCLFSFGSQQQLMAAMYGLKQGLGLGQVQAVAVASPHFEEQIKIVDFLDHELTMLDGLLTESQKAITLLKERRSALISAAVTGKIDVRGYAPQQEAV